MKKYKRTLEYAITYELEYTFESPHCIFCNEFDLLEQQRKLDQEELLKKHPGLKSENFELMDDNLKVV
jgi:hypothetical protein